MQSKPILALEDVKKIASAAEAEAGRNGWSVSIAVADDGGSLLWLQRMDNVSPITVEMAIAKAKTSALGRRETKIYEDMINNGRLSFLSAPMLEGMIEGGVPIFSGSHCVGAIGVSGVKSAEDVQIARAGVAALAS